MAMTGSSIWQWFTSVLSRDRHQRSHLVPRTSYLLNRPPLAPPPPSWLLVCAVDQTSNRDVEVFLPSAEASMRFAFSQLSRLPPGGVKWPSQSPSGGTLAKKRLPGGMVGGGAAEVVRILPESCASKHGR